MSIRKHNMTLSKIEKDFFAETFLEKYLTLGFGVMTKTEVDLLVFHLLLQTKEYKGRSNYELASKLKIPEQRIKALRLSSALKYEEINSKAVLGDVVLRLANGGLPKDFRGDKIEISLEDPIEKRELENFLKGNRHSAEYTLNTEVLRIEPIRLLELMTENLEKAERGFEKTIESVLDDQSNSHKAVLNVRGGTAAKLKKLKENVKDMSTLVQIVKGTAVTLAAL
jgi:hypothetical protein